MNSLSIRPLEETEQERLVARAKKFFSVAMGKPLLVYSPFALVSSFSEGCHHMEYEGEVSQYVEDVYMHFKADGRVMV